MRVGYQRGPASRLSCVGCRGVAAQEWAHIHGTDPEDTQNYAPLCIPCHKEYDGHPNSKLTQEQASEIRRRYAAGGVSQRKLGGEYGVSLVAVQNILNGKTWKERGQDHYAD